MLSNSVIVIIEFIVRRFELLNLLGIIYVFDPSLKIADNVLIVQTAQDCHLSLYSIILLLVLTKEANLLDSIYVLVNFMPC